MDYATACDELTTRMDELDPQDPLVPAALTFAIQPWLNGALEGPDMMRWGLFAGAVQAVTDRLWPAPASVALIPPPSFESSAELDSAAARLVSAVAHMLRHASRQRTDAISWDYAAASAELLEAARELE